MNRISTWGKVLLGSIVYIDADIVNTGKNKLEEGEETTLDRLRNVFRRDENGRMHTALISSVNTGALAFLISGTVGGIMTSRDTFISFLENNEATKFRDHREAKRLLSDKMMIGFYKGVCKYGIKIGFFCFIFESVAAIRSHIRKVATPFDYTISGACAGAIYKFNLGPKGMVAGSLVGIVCGTVYGGMNHLILKLRNLKPDDLRDFHKDLKIKREEAVLNSLKKFQYKEEQKELEEALKNVAR